MPAKTRQQRRREQRDAARRGQGPGRDRLWMILGIGGVIAVLAIVVVSSVLAGANKKSTTGTAQPTIDGIPCDPQEQVTYHVHTKLDIFLNGQHFTVPPYIGIPDSASQSCLYYLHTHDLSQYPGGLIHIEFPSKATPTLGQFLQVWRRTRTDDNGPARTILAGGPNLHTFVNRKPYHGDPLSIPLKAHELIAIDIGKKVVPPPSFTFPSGT